MLTASRASAAIAVAFALGVLLVGIAFLNVDDAASLWFEMGKAGLQLSLVAVAGGGVAALLRYIDARREDDRRLGDYLLATLKEVVEDYNRVKASRRRMRAAGLRRVVNGNFDQEQLRVFLTEMESLSEVQLSLEAVRRRTNTQQRLFGPDVTKQVGLLERYIADVTRYWELRHERAEPTSAKEASDAWRRFELFLARREAGDFANAWQPMDRIEDLILQRLA